jgi:hypothetical protein
MILVGELITTLGHPTNGRGKKIPRLPMTVYKVTTHHGERWVYCRTPIRDLKCTMPERCFQPWDFTNEVDMSEWYRVPSVAWEQ